MTDMHTEGASRGSADDGRTGLRSLVQDLELEAGRSSQRYRSWRQRYEALHYTLGVSGAALAAVASASAFADRVSGIVVGALAALASAVVAVQTVVRAERSARFNQTQEFACRRVGTRARLLLDVRWGRLTDDDRSAEYERLVEDYYRLRSAAPE